MGRRLLSHLLITLAVFSLIGVFFVTFIDNGLLNSDKLNSSLKDAKVPEALATAVPEIATGDADDITEEEKAEMQEKISKVVTPAYVTGKIESITSSLTSFMREGEPEPVLDVSDFPQMLRDSGVDVGEDLDKNFAEPIQLNKNGELDSIPQFYKTFSLVKLAAILLCVGLFAAEWFVAKKGDKLHRIGRIFLHAGLWFVSLYAFVVFVPDKFTPKLTEKIDSPEVANLVHSVVTAVQSLVSSFLLPFAVVCIVLAVVFYIVRHIKKQEQNIVPKTTPKTKK
jgi:predicted PurR-regulated permease PerM